jgi:hypothetical protein
MRFVLLIILLLLLLGAPRLAHAAFVGLFRFGGRRGLHFIAQPISAFEGVHHRTVGI